MKRFGLLFLLIAVLMLAFALPVSAKAELSGLEFNDVPENAWYCDYVYDLASMAIINGYDDGSFRPDKSITRAEIATILARMSGDNYKLYHNDSYFSDCGSHWAKAYINWAYANGVVNGMGNGIFAPDAPITREQLCTMVMNYAKYTSFYPLKSCSPMVFSDDAKISGWARDSVYHMQRAGIINGKGNNTFEPQSNATRAECAKIFYVFLGCSNDMTSKFVIDDFDGCRDYFGSVSSYFLGDYTHDGYEDLFIIEPTEYGAAIYVYTSLGGDVYCVYYDEVYPIAWNESYYLYHDPYGAYLVHYIHDSATGQLEQAVHIFYGNNNGDIIDTYNGYECFYIDGGPYDTGFPQSYYYDLNIFNSHKARSTFLFGSVDQNMTYKGQTYEKAVGNW